MKIRICERDSETLESILNRVSREIYGGHVSVLCDRLRTTKNGTTFRVKLGGSTGFPGSRTAASGRRGPWASWCAVRDALSAVFAAYPNAVVHTAFVSYYGANDFREKFPATYNHPVGSPAWPVNFGDTCVTSICPSHGSAAAEYQVDPFEVIAEGSVSVPLNRDETARISAAAAERVMRDAELAMKEFDSLGLPKERTDDTGKRNVQTFSSY